MARDGSGTANRVVSDYAFNTVIDEAGVNAELDDVYSELTNSIAADGQTNPTGNLPMATYRHTGVGNAAARDEYAAAGQVQDNSLIWCGTAGGTKNALTLTPSPAITAYAAGQRFVFIAGATASDSTVTVAISGRPAQAVQVNGAALSSSVTIEAGKLYQIDYNGTQFQLTRLSGVQQVATQAEAEAGTVDTKVMTPLRSQQQINAQLASQAEMEAGTATDVLVTPGRQRFHPAHPKAFAVVQTNGAAAASFGVSSVSDDGVGLFTLTWSTAFSSVSYAVLANAQSDATGSAGGIRIAQINNSNKTTGSCQVHVLDDSGSGADPNVTHVMALGDQ